MYLLHKVTEIFEYYTHSLYFKGVGGKSAYNPPAPNVPKPDKLMTVPKLPGVDPKNSYVETVIPVEAEKLMAAPTYRYE